jgi:hypothetical protein
VGWRPGGGFLDLIEKALTGFADGLALPRLRVLACYAAGDDWWSQPLPVSYGPLTRFGPLASTLEELAVVVVRAGACGLVFPRLRRLHASGSPLFDPGDPGEFARTFPALEEIVMGGDHTTFGIPLAEMPFASLPLLPRLSAVSLFKLSGKPPQGGACAHLGRCSTLTSLRMYDVTFDLEDVLLAARAPQLRRVCLECCDFGWEPPQPSALQAALRAAAGPERALDVSVSDDRDPAPYGLLPDGYVRGDDL